MIIAIISCFSFMAGYAVGRWNRNRKDDLYIRRLELYIYKKRHPEAFLIEDEKGNLWARGDK